MNRVEETMQACRDAEKGTYASGRAWVAHMREMKVPGTEPRREFADMMRRHRKWPLSMRVRVKTPQGYLEGKIAKHCREYRHTCIVDFSPNLVNYDGHGMRLIAYVPFRSIKKVNPK